jgi:hypothetical protein
MYENEWESVPGNATFFDRQMPCHIRKGHLSSGDIKDEHIIS